MLEPNPTASDFDWTASGIVSLSSPNSFILDTCAPDAGGACAEKTTVTVKGSTPDVTVPEGAEVEVHATAKTTYNGNAYSLSVKSGNAWYLLVSDGYLNLPEAPFHVDATVEAVCAHDFIFQETGGSPISIATNQITSFDLAGQSWDARVVRSYSGGGCQYDCPLPYAWWAARSGL